MIQWRLNGGQLVISDSSLLIPEIEELYNLNIAYLKYVFLRADISDDNPLRSLTEVERKKKALEMSIGNLVISDQHKLLIKKVIDMYEEYNKTSSDRFLKTIDDQLDQINDLLKTVKPKIEEGLDKNNNVVYNTNTDIIIKLMEKIDIIQSKRESIEKRSKRETAKVKSRGNKERSPLDKGQIKTDNVW